MTSLLYTYISKHFNCFTSQEPAPGGALSAFRLLLALPYGALPGLPVAVRQVGWWVGGLGGLHAHLALPGLPAAVRQVGWWLGGLHAHLGVQHSCGIYATCC